MFSAFNLSPGNHRHSAKRVAVVQRQLETAGCNIGAYRAAAGVGIAITNNLPVEVAVAAEVELFAAIGNTIKGRSTGSR